MKNLFQLSIAAMLGLIFLDAPIRAQTNPEKILPTPRTADGKPDLTGVYQASTRRGEWQDQGNQGRVPAPGEPAPARNETRVRNEPAPFQPWVAEKAKEFAARRGIDDPDAFCIPMGVPRFNLVGPTLFPMQIVQTPKAVLIIYENNNGAIRYIPLNAKHRTDIKPSYNGDSVGHWEGDTLVIDVTNFNDKTWIYTTGSIHTEAMHVVERYTRVDKDQLDYEAVVEDPNVLTKPWHLRETYMLRENTLLAEYVCAENNLDADRFLNISKTAPPLSVK